MTHRTLPAAALVALAGLACGRRSARDPIENGGFEDGLAGWTQDRAVVRARSDVAPHAGRSCAAGEVTPAGGWSLSQGPLAASKGTTYRIDAFLRAEGRAHAALWTQEGRHDDAQRLALWEEVPAEWTQVTAYVTAAHDGKLTLRFDAWPADGRESATVYLDDVTLTPAALPEATQVEPGLGFDDEPSMTHAEDGSYRVAWLSRRGDSEVWRSARCTSSPDGRFQVAPSTAPPPVPPEQRPSPQDEVLEELRDGNYDLYRRGDEGPDSARRLTHAPTIDRHPFVFVRDAKTWVLYENAETPGYRVELTKPRRLVVAKIDRDRLLAPKNYLATSPLWGERCESGAAAFDAKGRLWIVYRKPRQPQAGWDVFLTGWTGHAWVQPIPVSANKGMNRRPSLVIDGDRAVICFQADDLPSSWADIARAKDATSGVFLVSVPLPDVPAAPQELEPLVENPAPWEAAEIRHRFGDDAPRETTADAAGEKLRLLFGDLHAHSDVSVCERTWNGTADEVYAMQRDFEHLDFACLTDHGEDMNGYLWNYEAKHARANDVPGRFTTFLGLEWTSGYDPGRPQGFYGHRNVILADLSFPRWFTPQTEKTPADLWAALRAANANFVTIPHQLADVGNVPTDWSFVDETAQPVAEVFQIRGSYEAKDAPRVARRVALDGIHFLQDAWRRGVVCGVIASPDHGGGNGKACVWANENSREAILDAVRARHCYGTTGARIELDVRVAGHFMGERTSDGAGSDPVEIAVRAHCPGEIAKIAICRGGTWIHEDPAGEFRFVDEHPPAGPKWYYVRVEQKDGELAWSSPVWLGAPK